VQQLSSAAAASPGFTRASACRDEGGGRRLLLVSRAWRSFGHQPVVSDDEHEVAAADLSRRPVQWGLTSAGKLAAADGAALRQARGAGRRSSRSGWDGLVSHSCLSFLFGIVQDAMFGAGCLQ